MADFLEEMLRQLRGLDAAAHDHSPKRNADLDSVQHVPFPRESISIVFSLIKTANAPGAPDKISGSCCAPPQEAQRASSGRVRVPEND
ncbi:hypothetical protein [Bradyrhizobium iriomotense]|uniref:hypothetical protein n=1 Tax=Bradyrhizobium iriomotense TaxID=441950 RepID=UPI0024E09E6F|nr:hypothetical protein [Bradyrhizobium iriomotense]